MLSFFKKKLFIFGSLLLHAAFLKLQREGGIFSSCSVWTSESEHRLWSVGWVVAAHELSRSVAYGLFLDQGSNPVPCIGRWILNHWTTREVLLISCHIYPQILCYVKLLSPYSYPLGIHQCHLLEEASHQSPAICPSDWHQVWYLRSHAINQRTMLPQSHDFPILTLST